MKLVILAGGFGTRISEESAIRPKPMVDIGGQPILWHVMKIYAAHGVTDFVIAAGYKSDVIKDYFANYVLHRSDVTFDLARKEVRIHASSAEPWRVTVVDTGADTMTGGRLKGVGDHLDDETFCMTYGDCVADVNVSRLIEFHRGQGGLATLTAVQPPGRFGALTLAADEARIRHFHEKPDGDGAWVNGGFFVLEPGVLDYIDGPGSVWEQDPLNRMATDGELSAYKHEGFWHPMDTLRDRIVLDERWASGDAPWKVW